MSGYRTQSGRKATRGLTVACLVLVPALAIVALGSSLSLTMGGPAVPSGLLLTETREFARQGDAVPAAAKPADQGTAEEFADSWQNTVRTPPSPRR
jgi:hypothetical protein